MFGRRHSVSNAANSTHSPGALVVLRQVVKVYQSLAGSLTALHGVDLEVDAGEFVVILGKSGAGKTTLLNLISGLDRCSSGEIWVANTPVHTLNPVQAARWRGRTVGVVFQSFELLPSLTILHNVMLPADFANNQNQLQIRKQAYRLLDQMGIAEHAQKRPSAISGGQQQRVAIARALINDPPLLLADEPTGSLDETTADEVLTVIEQLVSEGTTVLLATHDLDVAERASRVIHLMDGLVMPNSRRNDRESEVPAQVQEESSHA